MNVPITFVLNTAPALVFWVIWGTKVELATYHEVGLAVHVGLWVRMGKYWIAFEKLIAETMSSMFRVLAAMVRVSVWLSLDCLSNML